MATPKTGRPRGRPKGAKKDFRTDPDRVAVAYAWLLMEGGISENRAYLQGALFCALPMTMNVDPETPSVSFDLDNQPGIPSDPERGTATRLRKKGSRWRADPVARAHIDDLMNRIILLSDKIESSESGDYLPRLWRELKAL